MNQTEKTDLIGYTFIRNQIFHSGVTPSLRETGRVVGYNSPRSVQLMLVRLQKRGLLTYNKGLVKISAVATATSGERTVDVPLVGTVACGAPSLAEQEPEALIEISTRIAKPGGNYFLLRASGSSMDKSGIKNGDLVLVRQQMSAETGDRVVALINDCATIKHFYRDNGTVVLKPNSMDKKHKSIILSDDFCIQGVVIATLPKVV